MAAGLTDILMSYGFPLVSGVSRDELARRARAGMGPLPSDPNAPDLAEHALGSQLIAERLGPELALGMGFAREAIPGVASLLQTGTFFTPRGTGYDPGDMAANLEGISAAIRKRKERLSAEVNPLAARIRQLFYGAPGLTEQPPTLASARTVP